MSLDNMLGEPYDQPPAAAGPVLPASHRPPDTELSTTWFGTYRRSDVEELVSDLRRDVAAAAMERDDALDQAHRIRLEHDSLAERLVAAEARAGGRQPTFADLGEHVGTLLTAAEQQAQALAQHARRQAADLTHDAATRLEQAKKEADLLLAKARKDAEATRTAAEAAAAELGDRSTRRAEMIVRRAEEKAELMVREAMQQEQDLVRRREEIAGQLARVQQGLTEVTAPLAGTRSRDAASVRRGEPVPAGTGVGGGHGPAPAARRPGIGDDERVDLDKHATGALRH